MKNIIYKKFSKGKSQCWSSEGGGGGRKNFFQVNVPLGEGGGGSKKKWELN